MDAGREGQSGRTPDDLTCVTVPRLGKTDRYEGREEKSHLTS